MQTVQACHAAVAAAAFYANRPDKGYLVVCGVKSELALTNASEKLAELGVRHEVFREPDLHNQLTALATEPLGEEARRHMRKFQLLKGRERC